MGKGKIQSEGDWLKCSDPAHLLRFLRGRTSRRKRRLFAVVCCRRIVALLRDRGSQQALEVAERFLDGLASPEELARGFRGALEAVEEARGREWSAEAEANFCPTYEYCCVRAAYVAAKATCWTASRRIRIPEVAAAAALAAAAAGCAAQAALALEFGYHNADWDEPPVAANAQFSHDASWQARWDAARAEEAVQCRLLRELVMSPFRPVRMETDWLGWINGPIRRLLRAADRERRFDDLPVLADMLEDAGCASAPLLAHLRLPPAEHVRGCWAVDFLLRKE
jgi:hypothetical protein